MDNNIYIAQAKTTINELIYAGTNFDIDALDRLYHNDLQVIMTDNQGSINIANKQNFKDLFKSKLENKEAPLNDWARFDHIEADEKTAHILVRRKVKLMQDEQDITLSIDLVYQDDRWQVTREVIFEHGN